ncbi:hypothetical protein K438DRAFT_1769614 [Mycena galopus ATCC 62051]|nr:hypothetical protein K438DRAFT_1769614 [Mycena galopus ATCC 62051]
MSTTGLLGSQAPAILEQKNEASNPDVAIEIRRFSHVLETYAPRERGGSEGSGSDTACCAGAQWWFRNRTCYEGTESRGRSFPESNGKWTEYEVVVRYENSVLSSRGMPHERMKAEVWTGDRPTHSSPENKAKVRENEHGESVRFELELEVLRSGNDCAGVGYRLEGNIRIFFQRKRARRILRAEYDTAVDFDVLGGEGGQYGRAADKSFDDAAQERLGKGVVCEAGET